MKKFSAFFLPVGLLINLALLAGFGGNDLKTSNGAPPGNTDSPADGQNCTHCMGGTAVPVFGWITSDIPGTGYVPGTTYTITVTATGVGKKGFEVSPQDLTGNLVGTLIAGAGSKLVGVNKYVTHSQAVSTDPGVWNFQWIAPTTGTGDVTFYAAIAVGKPNTRVTTLTVSQSTIGISETGKASVKVFPNPVRDKVAVSLTMEQPGIIKIDLLSAAGGTITNLATEAIPAGEYSQAFAVCQPSGLYFLKIMYGENEQLVKVLIVP
jgi:hypothetical protein